jgi:heptosyltransferase-1/heptosyltransferase I
MLTLESIFRPAARMSAPFMDRALQRMANSRSIERTLDFLEERRVRRIDRLDSVLIVPDINIGDAVIGQSAPAVLKQFFPDVEISYVYQKAARPLVRGNPHIDRHYPFISGRGLPTRGDHRRLKALMKAVDFDLILVFSPYFSFTHLGATRALVIHPTRYIAQIIRAYSSGERPAHVAHRIREFTCEVGSAVNGNGSRAEIKKIEAPHIFASAGLPERRKRLEKRLDLCRGERRVLFHPETSSVYTQPPLDLQVEMIESLLEHDRVDRLLMSRGFTFRKIEERILGRIPRPLRRKVSLIPPETRIDEYAALADTADVFISGDTGPMHIAAARKWTADRDFRFRNATAVIGLFGATSSRIYGYDSRPGFLSSAQDAPARVFEGNPPCRDLTCIDKIYKRCPEVRCFEGLEAGPVVDYISAYLSSRV